MIEVAKPRMSTEVLCTSYSMHAVVSLDDKRIASYETTVFLQKYLQ